LQNIDRLKYSITYDEMDRSNVGRYGICSWRGY